MPNELRTPLRIFAAALSIVLLNTQLATAAQFPTPSAQVSSTPPVPAQIASAHTLYLTNAGGDPNFPIDQHRAYSAVYAAMQNWGRYQLVNSPAQADLVLSLTDVSPITDVVGYDNGTYSIHSPAFQLNIVDARTNQVIWTITAPFGVKGRGKTYDRWVDIAVTNLVSRMKVLSGETLSAAESEDLTTYPQWRSRRANWIIAGGTVAFAVGGGLLLHHLYEDSLANQKASQDKFCEQNNIPLSECAGG